jgi:tRNA threonylcarbamoyl adenosine modification protein YeaZ
VLVLLLAIDTSTPTVTAGVVSLLRPHELIGADGLPTGNPVELLAEHSVTDAFAHAERLMPLVHAALERAGAGLAALEAVVVGLGPGPFTGLRVGIATAQALGDALDLPVHGVGSHDGAAHAHLRAAPEPPAGPFLVVTDARRREVYLSGYAPDGRRLLGPLPVAPAAVPALLADQSLVPTALIGSGAPLLAAVLDVPAEAVPGLSAGLVLAAARPLLTGVVPGPLTPLYLRRPDATEPAARKSVLGR